MRESFPSVLVLFLALQFQAAALDQRPIAVAELARRSDLVLRGKVVSSTCRRDPEGRIFTTVELAVLEAWKGKPAGSIQNVVLGGGILGEEQVLIPGQVSYKLEEEAVAFLVFNPKGEAVTLGLSQGKFDVWLNAATGQKEARNPFWGSTPRPGNIQAASTDRQVLTLADLKRQVEASK